MNKESYPHEMDSATFAAQLESLQAQPHSALISMQVNMGVDFGERLGFGKGAIEEDTEAFRQTPLAPGQRDAIRVLGIIFRLMAEKGGKAPGEIGDMLKEPNRLLVKGGEQQRPIDILFDRLDDSGLHREDISQVVRVSGFFLTIEDAADQSNAVSHHN